MSSRDAFWEQLNGALDARRDPIEAPEVQRLLAEDPRLLADLVALRSSLGSIERARQRRLVVRAAAALLVAALGLAIAWSARRTAREVGPATPSSLTTAALSSSREPAAVASHPAPERSRVLAFRAEVTVEGPDGLRTTTFDGRRLSVSSASPAADEDAPYRTPSFVAVASSVVMSR